MQTQNLSFKTKVKRAIKLSLQRMQYETPNVFAPSVPMSERAAKMLDELRRNGVIRINSPALDHAAKGIQEKYFNSIESMGHEEAERQLKSRDSRLFIRNMITPERRELFHNGGCDLQSHISFKEPALAPVLFDADLSAVIYNYYKRQPYFRNQPLLSKIFYEGKGAPFENGLWHTDHLHQLSYMFLVSDVAEDGTRMHYALGSNRKYWPPGTYSEADVKNGGYTVFDLTGKAGTLYLFDAGGLHRGNYLLRSLRKIVHMNIVTGHNMMPGMESFSDWEFQRSLPEHMQKMLSKLDL